MTGQPRRLILGNGERYLQSVSKRKPGRTPEPPRSYEDARNVIRTGVLAAVATFETLPASKRLP
ncbi:MAG: hypothetical protein NT049_14890, partial [Planctomycetota bacterium]|nr:hypothetical protein [Planctomycetota bacterium]